MTGNREQVEYWNGPGGTRWVTHQEALDAMVRPFGLAAIERLVLHAGEHVLDIGCGCGESVIALAERVGPSGSVTGIDLSAPMIERARQRVPYATLIVGDAAEHPFDRRFSALYSRFGVMFFPDPKAAFARLRKLLFDAPVGRMAFVCWRAQAENEWASLPFAAVREVLPDAPLGPMDKLSGPGPFSLADGDATVALLRGAGFSRLDIAAFDHDVELSTTGLDDAVRFALTAGPASRLLAEATPEQKARAAERVAAALAPHLQANRVALRGAAWTVLARA